MDDGCRSYCPNHHRNDRPSGQTRRQCKLYQNSIYSGGIARHNMQDQSTIFTCELKVYFSTFMM